ncbi:MAG: hypothetical protein LBU90_05745 [Bacteroidales bacterium]|nr:hypothetical protein [Bacteroidales bacterium]
MQRTIFSVRYIVWVLVFCLPAVAFGQSFSVTATIDSTKILIGQQARVVVELHAGVNAAVQLPFYDEGLNEALEFVKTPQIDTMQNDGTQLVVNLIFTITGFREGTYDFRIGPFVVNERDTLWSNTMELQVVDFPVDLQGDIQDIQPLQPVIYSWRDYIWYIAGIAFLLILIAVCIIIWVKRPKQLPLFTKEEVIIPAHEKALQQLEALKAKKLCEHDKYKQFYTELTDIVRAYFAERYGIQTFEKTSDELIFDIAAGGKVAHSVVNDLRMVLQEADLVKFAKHTPLLQTAYQHSGMVLYIITETAEKESNKK